MLSVDNDTSYYTAILLKCIQYIVKATIFVMIKVRSQTCKLTMDPLTMVTLIPSLVTNGSLVVLCLLASAHPAAVIHSCLSYIIA